MRIIFTELSLNISLKDKARKINPELKIAKELELESQSPRARRQMEPESEVWKERQSLKAKSGEEFKDFFL